MVILIPFTLIFIAWGAMRRDFFPRWREAILFSSIVVSTLAALAVEVLSLSKGLVPQNIMSFWIVFVLLALHWAWLSPPAANAPIDGRIVFCDIDIPQVITVIVIGAAFYVALNVAPNSFDSMVYHLPRVMHWLQEGTVAYYPTDIVCQNWLLPGAQYLLLHIYALTGSDYYVNLLQWASFVGVAIAVSLIAEYLGAGKSGRNVSMVMAMTMPTALLQSTTSQSDLVFSLWIITAVVFLLRSMESGLWRDVICCGCAYGLAMLTKGTAVYFLPFVIWLAVNSVRKNGARGLLRPLVVLVIACSFILGWAVRYSHDRSHQKAEQGVSLYYLGDYSLTYMMSNASKHLFSECNINPEFFKNSCRRMVVGFNHKLGVPLDDSSTTTFGFAWDALHPLSSYHEDHIGNLVQILLLILAGLAAIFFRRTDVGYYLICLLVSIGIFIFTLRWGPTINRFHLPFILMAVPIMGTVWGKCRWRAALFALCLFLLVLPGFFLSVARPIEFNPKHNVLLLPRNLQYFANRRFWPSYIQGHAAVAKYMQERGCRVVGLISSEWSWEFPLWALTPRPARFCSVSADVNKSARNPQCEPCMIVALQKKMPEQMLVAGRKFYKAEEFFAMQIFLPVENGPANQK